MKSIMLDFETFGNSKNACVVQIGACQFDEKSGQIISTFFTNVDADSAIKSGAEMDASTVYWWLQQSPEAIQSVIAGEKEPIYSAFTKLNQYLEKADNIWSHATFDFVILTETLRRLSIKPLFSYRSARDLRTLNYLSKAKKPSARKGIHHNALDDCHYQVEYCVACLNSITRI
jgi:exodeoxyribonuclease VIII